MRIREGDIFMVAEGSETICNMIDQVNSGEYEFIAVNLQTKTGLQRLIIKVTERVQSQEALILNGTETFSGTEVRLLALLRPPFSNLSSPVLFVPSS